MRVYLHDNFINIQDFTNEELNRLKEMTELKLSTSVKISAETDAEKTELYNLLFNITVFFDAAIG